MPSEEFAKCLPIPTCRKTPGEGERLADDALCYVSLMGGLYKFVTGLRLIQMAFPDYPKVAGFGVKVVDVEVGADIEPVIMDREVE